LVLEQPGGGVGHTQVPLELERRDAVLSLRHQVHGQEPLRQRQLAGLEDGAADQAALVAAGAALEVQPLLAAELAMPTALATRADEAVRPAPVANQGLTLLRGSVAVEELRHRQASLVLHLALCRSSSDRKSTRLNSSHVAISYAVFCLKKKKMTEQGAPTLLLTR